MTRLPEEILSEIFLKTDFKTCISIGRYYEAKKLFNPLRHTWVWAAMNGYLGVLKWLHANNMEGCTTDALDWAAQNAHWDVLNWLHENCKEVCTKDALEWALRANSLGVIKWLVCERT